MMQGAELPQLISTLNISSTPANTRLEHTSIFNKWLY